MIYTSAFANQAKALLERIITEPAIGQRARANVLAAQFILDTEAKEQIEQTALRSRYLPEAKAAYEEEGEVEIDDNALVSAGSEPGAYVQAWVWVADKTGNEMSEDDDI